MFNVEVSGDKLVITVSVEPEPQVSKSGKSLVLASTHGNIMTPAIWRGRPVVVGLNAYVRA